ncbi:type 4a pilus biogenesis protein PilO [Acidihalobacter ferrooxydans]|uniref:type 4a pilus biogenesis protein PilO n=1 Tax=Acidihalobacter ferrooxydans TaxID=1765967 RepID=UPI001E3205BB|nr:type 4a pilus biogenesis protein PilO [Acidihalobacter ferrooxydans]
MNLSRLRDIDLDEIRNVDLNNIGSAPLWIKAPLLLLLMVVIIGAGYYFDTSNQQADLQQLQAQEQQLRSQFAVKARRAANLAVYEKQLAEMKRSFGKMLQQLPNKTEIPALLVDISETALSSGLTIDLFRPDPEKKEGFYAIKPISISARGTYPEIALFASKIAALPRIVTLGDISLKPVAKSNQLSMRVTARTYRYLPNRGTSR